MKLRLLLSALLLAGCATTGGSSDAPIYLIKMESGDTLAGIAQKYDTSWEKIARLNGLTPGAAPAAGTVIRVQPGPGGIIAGTTGPLASRGPLAGDTADASEFSKSDFPSGEGDAENQEEDDNAAAPEPRQKAAKGLFFGGGDEGAELKWPVRGELSSLFGRRGRKMHTGIDIRAKNGTEVHASGAGVVTFAGRKRGYGKVVVLKHRTHETLYAHLSVINVAMGDRVDQLTQIGNVGRTGNASGYHLHFEIRTLADTPIDPLTILRKTELLSQR